MIYQVKDNVIVTDTSAIIPISNTHNKISVVVKAPISSVVFLTIKGFQKPYIIPLFFVRTSEEGNIFSESIRFLLEHIKYIGEHPNKVYKGTLSIDGIPVEGTIKFMVNSMKIAQNNKQDNDVLVNLTKEYAKLRSEIYMLKKTYPKISKSPVDLKKGMVPVATGSSNEYVWDYPLTRLHTQVKELIKLNKELADQNAKLVEKVNELEKKLTDHIYEEYEL